MSISAQFSWLLAHSCNLKHILQTHAYMLPRALDHDNLLLARFIHACSSLGFSHYAYSLFTSCITPDIFLHNAIIKTLSSSQPKTALSLYSSILLSGCCPDHYSFPFALKAVIRLSALETGTQIHSQVIRFGFHSHLPILTALIQMYSSMESSCAISDARKLFDDALAYSFAPHLSLSLPLWNAMLAAYAKLGDLHNARHLFERMPHRNLISWTTLITAYAQTNLPHHAISIFRRMQLQDVQPDEVALSVTLSACARLGALELGEWIHNYIHKHGLHPTLPLNNALIDMYAKSGNIKKALQVFHNMKLKSIVTWTTMIAGLALHGLAKEALQMFSRMERAGVQPNHITFIAILSACNHAGLLQMGLWCFNIMISRFGIQPKIQHYGCIIDLLARAGYLQEAQLLLRQMPFEPNAAIWGSLLAASNTHGDAMLGELALQHLIKLEPNNSGNYALLTNIYASLGRWNESRMIRKGMRDSGVKKMPGGSFIEVNNRVHEFIAEETSHPQLDRIYEVLCSINGQLAPAKNLLKECCGCWQLEFGDG